MNKIDSIIILVIFILLSYYMGLSNAKQAMINCQKKYSFDTCYTTLNR